MDIDQKIDDMLAGEFHYLEHGLFNLIKDDPDIMQLVEFIICCISSDLPASTDSMVYKLREAEFKKMVREKVRPHAEQAIRQIKESVSG